MCTFKIARVGDIIFVAHTNHKMAHIHVVRSKYDGEDHFLATFLDTASRLGPHERIGLEVRFESVSGTKMLERLLSGPHADKVVGFEWKQCGKESVDAVALLLRTNCPELESLHVHFPRHPAIDFVSSVLECTNSNVATLVLGQSYVTGDVARFFAALEMSRVTSLVLNYGVHKVFDYGLCDYLAKNALVELTIDTYIMPEPSDSVFEFAAAGARIKPDPSAMTLALAGCTKLTKLALKWCVFKPNAFAQLPSSITHLTLNSCTFSNDHDWSFLAVGSVQAFDLSFVTLFNVDGLGRCLVDNLRGSRRIAALSMGGCAFEGRLLLAVGADLFRLGSLKVSSTMDDAPFAMIAAALQSPDCAMKTLDLLYWLNTVKSIETHVVPALLHPNCSLTKLRLPSSDQPANEVRTKFLECQVTKHHAMFVLLQGQQMRRRPCPLRKLPVEMFRMMGALLL